LVHHLNVLRKEKKIKAIPYDKSKRYFLKDQEVPLSLGLDNEILRVIYQFPGINLKAISQFCEISLRTIQRHARKLKEKGLIEFIDGRRVNGFRVSLEVKQYFKKIGEKEGLHDDL